MSLRGSWKPLAATITVAVPGYLFYQYRVQQEQFEIPVRVKGPDGKVERATRSFPMLPMKVLEARLNQNASAHIHSRPGGITWKHTTASLASNEPLEDANSNAIVQRDDSDPAAPGDFLFFAVMDGHGGYETSQLLSRIIIKGVAAKISALNAEPVKPISSWWNAIRGTFVSAPQSAPAAVPGDADPARVSNAIQEAFTELDTELINAPLHILASNIDDEALKKNTIPDLSKHPLALTTMRQAISGSCALVSVFDTAHQNLYVAVTGDSRAVAGVWEPSEDGQGSWRVEALTEDQTGRNPSELARMQSEHPKDEADDVIRNGRVLGGLEPTRAFGDARYKWPRDTQEVLSQAFLVGNGSSIRSPPSLLKTPPYVTARPVVTHRKLALGEGNPTGKPGYFLVMATDGLWDELSNDDVISLVGGYLSGLKGTVAKAELPALVPISSGAAGVEGKRARKENKVEGAWAFVDDNASVHLIRNAFGGGDEHDLRQRLSIPAPHSRRYRDDVTVTVVWWENGVQQRTQVSRDMLKSKL